jgi:hypothetical protein
MALTRFLTFNMPMPREKGGTYEDLWATLGRNTNSIFTLGFIESLEVDSLDEAVHAWLKDTRVAKTARFELGLGRLDHEPDDMVSDGYPKAGMSV